MQTAGKNILVTGGAGFIGSAVVRHIIQNTRDSVVNLDKLTYAGNLESLTDIADNPRYAFEQVDICDRAELDRVFAQYRPDAVMHLAAESHVDRAIGSAGEFIRTNIVGTFDLLEAARAYWQQMPSENAKPSVSTIFLPMKSMAICTAQTICLQKPRHTRRPAPTPPPKPPPTTLSARGSGLTGCPPLSATVPIITVPDNSPKTHSFDDSERTFRQTTACVRRRGANPRLAVCRRPRARAVSGRYRRCCRRNLQYRRTQ